MLIDTQLNFLPHIKSITQKIFRSIEIILKLLSFLQLSAFLVQLFPNTSSIIIWPTNMGSAYSKYLSFALNKIKLQRIINNGCYQDHVSSQYSSLKIPKMTNLFKPETAKSVYFNFHKKNFLLTLIFFQNK